MLGILVTVLGSNFHKPCPFQCSVQSPAFCRTGQSNQCAQVVF